MQFKISAETRGGLRVIPTIPNINRCWLEGRNGIGKTIAVRLLELVAGKQPYAHDVDGWRALKESLGPTTVTITEFPASSRIRSIRVDLEPHQWPNHPVQLTTDLGEIHIDDNRSDYQALRSYFDIFRISGDETVVSQLRDLVGADLALAVRYGKWLEDAAKEVEGILTPLIIDLGRLSELEFDSADRSVQQARARVAKSNSQLQDVSQRQQDLRELIELSELQKEQALLGPRVQASLEDSTSRIQELTALKNNLAHQLGNLVPKRAESQQLQSELERLRTLRDGRRTRAARAYSTAQRRLQAAGVEAGTVSSVLRGEMARRRALREERAALAVLPDVLEMIGSTRVSLGQAEDSSLDAEIVAIIERTQRVSASALRAGLDARTAELKRDDSYDVLADIDRQLGECEARIHQLRGFVERVRDAKRKASLLSEIEEQIDQTTRHIRESTGNEYAELSERLQNVELELTDAIRHEAECSVHLDLLNRRGGSEELARKLAELEHRLDVSYDDATDALRESTAYHSDLSAEYQQDRHELAANESMRASLEEQLVRAVRIVGRGPDYQWLRNSLSKGHLPTDRTDRSDAIRLLTRLGEVAKSVQSGVDESLNQIATIQRALDDIGRAIARHVEPPRNPYGENLSKWYAGQMAEYLSNEYICEAIFDGGEFLDFDLIHGFVSWRTKAGEDRRRPIEAFSSGERAFAYVLAAILSQSKSTAQYRVLVLDEFGAFVEHSRRNRLWHFLHERVLEAGMAHQVIVILPWQASLPSIEHAERFESDGYFCD